MAHSFEFRYYFFATQDAINDPAYDMDDEEVEEFIKASHELLDHPEHMISSPPPPSPSPEPDNLSEYLQPVDSDHEVAHILDDPSESETESEPEDLAAQLSDGDWTEIAATTASTNVSANIGKGVTVSFSTVSILRCLISRIQGTKESIRFETHPRSR